MKVILSEWPRIEYLSKWSLEAGELPSPELVLAYRDFDTSGRVYAPWGLHYLLRLWHYDRWFLHDILIDHGILAMKEKGGFYKDCKITPFKYWTKKKYKLSGVFYTKDRYIGDIIFYVDNYFPC